MPVTLHETSADAQPVEVHSDSGASAIPMQKALALCQAGMGTAHGFVVQLPDEIPGQAHTFDPSARYAPLKRGDTAVGGVYILGPDGVLVWFWDGTDRKAS